MQQALLRVLNFSMESHRLGWNVENPTLQSHFGSIPQVVLFHGFAPFTVRVLHGLTPFTVCVFHGFTAFTVRVFHGFAPFTVLFVESDVSLVREPRCTGFTGHGSHVEKTCNVHRT